MEGWNRRVGGSEKVCACERTRESVRPSSAEGEKREWMNRETGTEGALERVISTFCGFAYIYRFSDFHVRIAKCATSYVSPQRQSPISSLVSAEYVLPTGSGTGNKKKKLNEYQALHILQAIFRLLISFIYQLFSTNCYKYIYIIKEFIDYFFFLVVSLDTL